MHVSFTCPNRACRKQVQAPASAEARAIACPFCGQRGLVKSAEGEGVYGFAPSAADAVAPAPPSRPGGLTLDDFAPKDAMVEEREKRPAGPPKPARPQRCLMCLKRPANVADDSIEIRSRELIETQETQRWGKFVQRREVYKVRPHRIGVCSDCKRVDCRACEAAFLMPFLILLVAVILVGFGYGVGQAVVSFFCGGFVCVILVSPLFAYCRRFFTPWWGARSFTRLYAHPEAERAGPARIKLILWPFVDAYEDFFRQ